MLSTLCFQSEVTMLGQARYTMVTLDKVIWATALLLLLPAALWKLVTIDAEVHLTKCIFYNLNPQHWHWYPCSQLRFQRLYHWP